MLISLKPAATASLIVRQAPTLEVGSIEAAPRKRPGWSPTIWRTSSLATLPSTPASRPTTTPRSMPASSISCSSSSIDCCCAAAEGSKPTVRVKPSRRSPAEYISVFRKPPSGGRRRESMIMEGSRSGRARGGASHHLVLAVVGLAVAVQRGRLQAGVQRLDAGVDLLAVLREQRVALEVALDDEGAEVLDLEQPHRLGDAEFVEPVHLLDPLDAAAQQRAGAVADRGQVDRAAGREHLLVVLGRHAALADQDAGAGLLDPARDPFGEAEAGRRRHRADVVAPFTVGRGGRRAMEVNVADAAQVQRQCLALVEHLLVDAFARRVDDAVEVDRRAELELGHVLAPGRQVEMKDLHLVRLICGAVYHSTVSLRM